MTTTGARPAGRRSRCRARPQGQRQRHEVGHRRPLGRAAPARAAQLAHDPVISLPERRRGSGAPAWACPWCRRELHEGYVLAVASGLDRRRADSRTRPPVRHDHERPDRRARRPASSPVATTAAGDTEPGRAAPLLGQPGLSGTYTPPARHTPNRVATTSGPFGSMTPTAAGAASARAPATSVARSWPGRVRLDPRRGPPRRRRRPRPRTGGRRAPRPRRSRRRPRRRRLPLRLAALGEGNGAFRLVGMAPHRHEVAGAGPAGVGQPHLQCPPQRLLGRGHGGRRVGGHLLRQLLGDSCSDRAGRRPR